MQIQLTQKERMLLEDQKSQEEICVEKYTQYAGMAKDPQLKQVFMACAQSEQTHLDSINQLLQGTIPQMQQGQQGGQQGQQQQQSQQQPPQNVQQVFSDKSLCTDMLSTEKHVSKNYDTAIFEFRDTRVRDVLNHIQKEEQKHGESIFQYMESKGMYNVQ